MKKKKDNKYKKSVLLSALLAIGLVGLLVGATYAWFSDSVSSKVNRIEAGNLDVSLKHKVGDSFEEVKEDTELFDITLWEPGAMAYENFEIANEGSLALYYNLIFNTVNFNTVNENNKSLKDVLKVAIVEGEFSGDRTVAQGLNYRSTIDDFAMEKPLIEKGTSDKFAVVVYWEPSDADNEFNLNNGKTSDDGEPLYIDLGISLEARQFSFEEDSFGNEYDAVEVSTSAELKASIMKATNGEAIRLANDIAYTGFIEFPENANVIIDLNNHTLSGNRSIYVDPERKVKIENGVLNLNGKNLSVSTIPIYDNASLTLENVHVISNTAGAITPWGKNTVINIINCKIETVGYAFSTNASNPKYYYPTVNIKNTQIIASTNVEHVRSPILLNVPGQLNIENSSIEGYRNAVIVRGGTAVIKNSTLTNNVILDSVGDGETAKDYLGESWDQGSGVPYAALVMGNRSNSSYRYPTNVTLINTTINSIDKTYPEVYAYGNTEEGMGVTFNYDESSNVGNVTVGNDKVVINEENAPINE